MNYIHLALFFNIITVFLFFIKLLNRDDFSFNPDNLNSDFTFIIEVYLCHFIDFVYKYFKTYIVVRYLLD